MPILNYTTQIKASKTVGEILDILARQGADNIQIEYGQPFAGERVPVALTFMVTLHSQPIYYRLPVRWQGVRRALRKEAPRYQTDEQAFRVAWRIIKDWVEAQLALIQSEQAELAEVFLPYAVMPDGVTVWEQFKARQLPPPIDK
jgi:hypothetical protein